MDHKPNGELVPIGGGDPIPLIRSPMKVGRRDSCDISLRFPNVSGEHSELIFEGGCWIVHDLGSTNGTRVNGVRVKRKLVKPGDEIGFANRSFRINYQETAEMRRSVVVDEGVVEDSAFEVPLLERAGLVRRREDQNTPPPKTKPIPRPRR